MKRGGNQNEVANKAEGFPYYARYHVNPSYAASHFRSIQDLFKSLATNQDVIGGFLADFGIFCMLNAT